MEKVLWIPENWEGLCRDDEGYLLPASEIEKRVYVSEPGIRVWPNESPYKFKKNFKQNFAKFKKELSFAIEIYKGNTFVCNEKVYIEDLFNLEEGISLETKFELLDILVGSEGKFYCNEFVPYGEYLAFELYGSDALWEEDMFFSVDDMEYHKVFEWWDGSNWSLKDNFNVAEYEIELTDDKYNLDIHDGRNWFWGARFAHALLCKVEKVDGEAVEDTILWWSWSQYQGNLDTGELMTSHEVIRRLECEKHPHTEEIKRWLKKVARLTGERKC